MSGLVVPKPPREHPRPLLMLAEIGTLMASCCFHCALVTLFNVDRRRSNLKGAGRSQARWRAELPTPGRSGPTVLHPGRSRSCQNRKRGGPAATVSYTGSATDCRQPRATPHNPQSDRGRRDKRNERKRDDEQSIRWRGAAVGRRPHGAVTESARFRHPAPTALHGRPWNRRCGLAQ